MRGRLLPAFLSFLAFFSFFSSFPYFSFSFFPPLTPRTSRIQRPREQELAWGWEGDHLCRRRRWSSTELRSEELEEMGLCCRAGLWSSAWRLFLRCSSFRGRQLCSGWSRRLCSGWGHRKHRRQRRPGPNLLPRLLSIAWETHKAKAGSSRCCSISCDSSASGPGAGAGKQRASTAAATTVTGRLAGVGKTAGSAGWSLGTRGASSKANNGGEGRALHRGSAAGAAAVCEGNPSAASSAAAGAAPLLLLLLRLRNLKVLCSTSKDSMETGRAAGRGFWLYSCCLSSAASSAGQKGKQRKLAHTPACDANRVNAARTCPLQLFKAAASCCGLRPDSCPRQFSSTKMRAKLPSEGYRSPSWCKNKHS